MSATHIEWAQAVWNPTTGCDRISPGCRNCYAITMARRLKAMGAAKYHTDGDVATSGPGFGVAFHADALEIPLRWRTPRRVFVNSMSDLFHRQVADVHIAAMFAVMAAARQHDFLVLTKRAGRMRSLLHSSRFRALIADKYRNLHGARHTNNVGLRWPLANVWLGVSAENQTWADIRIPALLDTPAALRWVSAEPLLGPIDLRQSLAKWTPDERQPWDGNRLAARQVLNWVVAGGESGPQARPMHIDWARSLRDQCHSAGIAFFFKQAGSVLARQWGSRGKGSTPAGWRERFPRQYPQAVAR
ncbi:DUF5131 family protein [Mycobacterium xenopi]|uniref:DUF5131 family protein n=1 Tax=Mycobacterium xenopi TaxID=1789 RepID=UPI000A15C488|nr:phage Gp37/Gp68 family protein [Mycobacterium xenopi]ORX13063.1 hypothetical protein AWC32_15675 [Mycobacterium xenopi]SPX94939.1 bacteriophage protein gp37 [Mycobacterium xenopi]